MSKKQKKSLAPLLIAGALLIVVIILFPRKETPQKTGSVTSTPHATQIPKPQPPPQYSDEVIHKFWDDHLNKLVMIELVGGKHPVPRVNALYQEEAVAIMRRYGKIYRIEPSNKYQENYIYAGAGCDIKDGTPILRIFVPNMMYIYNEFFARCRPGTRLREHGNTAHLPRAGSYLTRIDRRPGDTDEELVAEEVATWAVTCEHIGEFLSLKIPVDASHLSYYKAWDGCGQQRNQCWTNFIGRTYAPVSKKLH